MLKSKESNFCLNNNNQLHCRPEGTASRNFLKHKNRLVENEDYYILESQNNEIRGLENISNSRNHGYDIKTKEG